jgi:hypothetical protein
MTISLAQSVTFTRGQILAGEVDVRELLRGRDRPDYRVLMTKSRDEYEKTLAREGSFVVFPTIDVPTALVAPVDWLQDPFTSFSWRAQLHSLRFLDALFQMYIGEGDVAALDQAQQLALDWISQNSHGAPGISVYAWFDRLVGDRVPYLAYLLAAASYENRLSAPSARALFASVVEHADVLADDANYTAGTNHGLFQDAGLLLAANYLPFLEDSRVWREHASARFLGTLGRHVDLVDGVHLEHSPSYHADVAALGDKVRRLANVDDPRLNSVVDRLMDNAGWFVMPDGCFPPMGDTDCRPALAFARTSATGKHGLKLFPRAGWAVAKEVDSYLAVSAGFHSKAHKHADDLSFCLYEQGSLVITEVGKYGYDEDVRREYALSSRAHNVVLVDGINPAPGRTKPYGSGIRCGAAADGWYAVEATNEILRASGLSHRRVLLFRPGVVLLVVDAIAAAEEHVYTRLFHLGPEIEVERDTAPLHLSGPSFSGCLFDASDIRVDERIARGQTDPELKGWSFPELRVSREIFVVELESCSADAVLSTVIGLTASNLDVSVVAADDEVVCVAIEGERFGGSLRFDAGAARLDVKMTGLPE